MENQHDDLVDLVTPRPVKKATSAEISAIKIALESMKVPEIAKEFGRSRQFIQNVKKGRVVPHPDHPRSEHHSPLYVTPPKGTLYVIPSGIASWPSRVLECLRMARDVGETVVPVKTIADSIDWPREASLNKLRHQILYPMREDGKIESIPGKGYSIPEETTVEMFGEPQILDHMLDNLLAGMEGQELPKSDREKDPADIVIRMLEDIARDVRSGSRAAHEIKADGLGMMKFMMEFRKDVQRMTAAVDRLTNTLLTRVEGRGRSSVGSR